MLYLADRQDVMWLAKREVATNLLEMKFPIDAIAKATGLPAEEIQALGRGSFSIKNDK